MDFSKFHIYLRAFEPDDYKTTYLWRKDEDILKGIVGKKYFVSSEYEKKWINDAIFGSNSVKLAICLKETEKHIGNVYLDMIDHMNKNCTIGVIIGDKNIWGQGLGSEALVFMLYYAFYELGMIRVSSTQLLTNKSSIKLTEKCGFKNEGVLRKAIFKNGEYCDLNILSIIRDDFDEFLKSNDYF